MSEKSDWLDRLDPKRKRLNQLLVVGTRVIMRDEANEWLLRVDETHQRGLSASRVERYRRFEDPIDPANLEPHVPTRPAGRVM